MLRVSALRPVLPLTLMLSASSPIWAEMKALDDDILSGVSGQSGITLDVQSRIELAEISYFDDGLGLALQGVRLNSPQARTQADWNRFLIHEARRTGGSESAITSGVIPFQANMANYTESRVLVDILSDSSLVLDVFTLDRTRFEIEDIRFVNAPGQTAAANARSLGGLYFDFQLDGNVSITGAGTDGSSIFGGRFDIDLLFENVRLGYRSNGNEVLLDNMTVALKSTDTVLTFDATDSELDIRLPSFVMETRANAIRYSDNPLNHGVSNDVVSGSPLASYGSLWTFMDLNSNIQVAAGGASGAQGIRFNAQTVVNWLDLLWGDDIADNSTRGWFGAVGGSGTINVQNLYVDVTADPDAGVTPAKNFGTGLSFSFERLQANLGFRDFVIGANSSEVSLYRQNGGMSPIRSIGSVSANLLFANGSYDGVTSRSNRILLQAGGNVDAGYQGIRLDTQLSVISPANESNFIYTENGNSMMWSRFEAFADCDLTIDITRAGNINGTDFYNGLRLGFEDFAFGYRVEGYRVAKSTGNNADLNNQRLQAATTLPGVSGSLMGIGGYPALEGTLNGHVTIGPGGNRGAEGLTINSDLTVSNGNMAKYLEGDGTGRGIWLSGLNYDVHLRDMLVDVSDQGMEIYETERWSTMDVTDLRIGDKTTGASFGRVVHSVYELGSERVFRHGGAGNVCVGAAGATSAQCASNGGFWSARGDQGLTVTHVRHLAPENVAENKRNRFTWEVGRTGEGTASPVNGSGMQLVFDNYTTNDGDGLTDSYGLRSVSQIDLAQTRVFKKTNGPDSNGVVGNRGDEKIMNADGTYRYVAPSALTAADRDNRPVGIAVRNTTSFRELDVDSVKLAHPTGGDSTLLYGLKLQNFEVRTDITATPLD